MNDALKELYQDVIIDHYNHPRCNEPIVPATSEADGVNPLCGDEVSLTLKIQESMVVSEIGVCTQGCSICTASGSIMAEELEGKSISDIKSSIDAFKGMMAGGDVLSSTSGDIEALSGVKLFPVRIKCALLPWMTLQQAIDQYEGVSKENHISTEE